VSASKCFIYNSAVSEKNPHWVTYRTTLNSERGERKNGEGEGRKEERKEGR
jgi:hypothetical protein